MVLVVILTYCRYEWTGNVCIPRRVVQFSDSVGDVLEVKVHYWWSKKRIEGTNGGIKGLQTY